MAKKKDKAAVALGRKGGSARAKALSAARRREIARLGGLTKARNARARRKQG